MTLDERTKAVVESEEFLSEICGDVANGGSLIDYCKTKDIRYSDAVKWVYDRQWPERAKAYDLALLARSDWSFQRVLKEIQLLGTVDIRKAFNDSGGLKPIQDIPEDVARAIVGIESVELFEGKGENRERIGELKKIKFSDKIRALELMGKQLSMFKEQVEHSGVVGIEKLIEESFTFDAEQLAKKSRVPDLTSKTGEN